MDHNTIRNDSTFVTEIEDIESENMIDNQSNYDRYHSSDTPSDMKYYGNSDLRDESMLLSNNNNHTNNEDSPSPVIGHSNLFDITPDMEQAMRELELRQRSAEFDENYDYDHDLPPEYDVREKLESLNAQLASEPLPPDHEHRNSRVVFSEELVSLVAPPADPQDYSLSSGEEDSLIGPIDADGYGPSSSLVKQKSTEEPLYDSTSVPNTSDPNNHLQQLVNTDDQSRYQQHQHNHENDFDLIGSNDDSQQNSTAATNVSLSSSSATTSASDTTSNNQKSDGILVNRNGEYSLVGENDMIGLSEQANDQDKNQSNHRRFNRPTSAPASKRNRYNDSNASSSSGSFRSEHEVRSASTMDILKSNKNNQIPQVDREALRRQKERQERREREEKEQEKARNEEKQRNNERVFNVWYQYKVADKNQQKIEQRKIEEKERERQEKEQEDKRQRIKEKEDRLKKQKEDQKQREEKLRQYRLKEHEESTTVHTEDECENAFKQWLRRKRREHKQRQKEERQRARITRLAMRQCRKSQNLAQAIHEATTFSLFDN